MDDYDFKAVANLAERTEKIISRVLILMKQFVEGDEAALRSLSLMDRPLQELHNEMDSLRVAVALASDKAGATSFRERVTFLAQQIAKANDEEADYFSTRHPEPMGELAYTLYPDLSNMENATIRDCRRLFDAASVLAAKQNEATVHEAVQEEMAKLTGNQRKIFSAMLRCKHVGKFEQLAECEGAFNVKEPSDSTIKRQLLEIRRIVNSAKFSFEISDRNGTFTWVNRADK